MLNSDTGNNQGSGKILFVDDEENILKTLLRHFSDQGYSVYTANSGKDALNILQKENIDVVVTDMRMPEMDGETLLKEISSRWPDISRILLTGYADLSSVISAVNNGKIDYFLTKPWEEHQINSIVQLSVKTKELKEKNKQLSLKIQKQNEELVNLNKDLKQKVEERTAALNDALKKQKQDYASLVQICSNLINIYDRKYRNHTQKVADLAAKLAKALNLNEDQVNNIYFSGLLYNIGKLGLSKDIIETPYKNLAPEQKRIFEQYPIVGATALSSMDALDGIVEIIVAHRERFNGLGYPKKLPKASIPLSASILSVAIDFEQLQLGLLLPEKLSSVQALAYLESYRAIHYPPEVVDAFVNLIESLPQERSKLKEKAISARMLVPGMKLSKDLYSVHNILLLPKGKVINEEIINNLLRLDEMSVWIVVD